MKERTIIVNGAPFTYMDEVGDEYSFKAMTQKDLSEMLELTASLLKECGIDYVLAFGTLLGAVREGNVIKGDEDIDIIVMDENKLYDSLPYLSEHGLFINRIYETELYEFHTKERKGYLDMYIMHPIEKGVYKNRCVSIRGHYAPKRFFEGTDSGNFRIDGKCYSCPAHPEELLEYWYGKTWRIPQSKKPVEDVLIRRIELFPSKMYHKVMRKVKRWFNKGDR